MPIKRRISKHRPEVAPEAWDMVFLSGYDFFGALEALGLPEPRNALPDSDECKAAQAAWREHGAIFLNKHSGCQGDSQTPWALERFGPPEGYADAS